MDTSTICDSEDFNEEEWRSQMKKHRRDNAKRIYSNGSSDEDTRLSEEECTIRRRRKAPNDECHYEKKIKRISNQSNSLLQLPLLPKQSISLSSPLSSVSNLHIASTSKFDKSLSNIQISKFLLLHKDL